MTTDPNWRERCADMEMQAADALATAQDLRAKAAERDALPDYEQVCAKLREAAKECEENGAMVRATAEALRRTAGDWSIRFGLLRIQPRGRTD